MRFELWDKESGINGIAAKEITAGLPREFQWVKILDDEGGLVLFQRIISGDWREEARKLMERLSPAAATGEIEEQLRQLTQQVRSQSVLAALSVGAEVEITPEILTAATQGAPITELSDNEQWRAGVSVSPGIKIIHTGITYECVQGHVTFAGWEPDKTPALWKAVAGGGNEFPLWVRPTGAHDAYAAGQGCTFEGKRYTSIINGNVYSPAEYPQGWRLETQV